MTPIPGVLLSSTLISIKSNTLTPLSPASERVSPAYCCSIVAAEKGGVGVTPDAGWRTRGRIEHGKEGTKERRNERMKMLVGGKHFTQLVVLVLST